MPPFDMTQCPVCGADVWHRPDGKGWPKTYCDPACRRAADAERRKARAARRRDAERLIFEDVPLFSWDGPRARR